MKRIIFSVTLLLLIGLSVFAIPETHSNAGHTAIDSQGYKYFVPGEGAPHISQPNNHTKGK